MSTNPEPDMMEADADAEETAEKKSPMRRTAAWYWLEDCERRTGADCCKDLVRLVIQREKEVLGEMSDWRLRRQRADEYMQNNFEARKSGLDGEIFELRNETMGLVRSGIGFLTARIQDDIFGSAPWFAAVPEGNQDVNLAAKLQQHAGFKLREARFQNAGEDAVERVLNFGEAILRTAWKRDVQEYARMAMVLVDAAGTPVLDSAGNYVEEDEEFVPASQLAGENAAGPESAEGGEEMEQAAPEAAPAGMESAPDKLVLARDPSVVMEEGMIFAEWQIDEREVRYNGLDPQLIHWTNFRASPSYPTLEDCPFRGHIYEMPMSALKARMREYSGVPEAEWDEDTRRMFDRLRADDTAPKTEERQKNPDPGAAGGDHKDPVVKCMDFEMAWDPAGEGNPRLLFGTVLVDSEQLFFCDYLMNILPGGKSLYTVVSAYNLPGRWSGRGWWELFEDVNNNSDRLWNCLLHRNEMISNPMTGVHEDVIKEDIMEVKFRAGERVTLNAGKTMKDFVEVFAMPNMDAGTWQLLEWFLKLNQLETGVTSSAQGGLGDMPATSTATGIQSVLASGSTLHKRPARNIRDGLADGLWKLLTLLYANQDKDETFTYGEGENETVAMLSRREVRGLKLNVRLTMTRFRQREVIEHSQQAIEVHQRYLALPENEKAAARPLYLELLRNLDIPGAETILRMPVDVPPPAPPLRETVNFSYKDLPPEAQFIALQQIGLEVPLEVLQRHSAEQQPAPKPPGEPKALPAPASAPETPQEAAA